MCNTRNSSFFFPPFSFPCGLFPPFHSIVISGSRLVCAECAPSHVLASSAALQKAPVIHPGPGPPLSPPQSLHALNPARNRAPIPSPPRPPLAPKHDTKEKKTHITPIQPSGACFCLLRPRRQRARHVFCPSLPPHDCSLLQVEAAEESYNRLNMQIKRELEANTCGGGGRGFTHYDTRPAPPTPHSCAPLHDGTIPSPKSHFFFFFFPANDADPPPPLFFFSRGEGVM